jgi:DNA-binding NarL/FixJ family response regulator
MKIILVEDDPNKLKQLWEFISRSTQGAHIVVRRSYQSGLSEILNSTADLVLLDMSMPTYDQSPTESGGRKRPFAGREILRKMNRHGKDFPVLIITQFTRFGDGPHAISLEELTTELEQLGYQNYLGTIYYSSDAANWEEKLLSALRQANR